METQFKDVAHLYLGCEVKITHPKRPEHLMAGMYSFQGAYVSGLSVIRLGPEVESELCDIEQVKPILRPLSSMTEDEKGELRDLMGWPCYCEWQASEMLTPKGCAYLLSNGFDLFNLIPSGQAIDATTLTPETNR